MLAVTCPVCFFNPAAERVAPVFLDFLNDYLYHSEKEPSVENNRIKWKRLYWQRFALSLQSLY
jgi:hypothetical protein